jgi:hypothetical protein
MKINNNGHGSGNEKYDSAIMSHCFAYTVLLFTVNSILMWQITCGLKVGFDQVIKKRISSCQLTENRCL